MDTQMFLVLFYKYFPGRKIHLSPTLSSHSCFTGGLLRLWGFPSDSVVKNPLANVGGVCSIPGLGRSPGESSGNPSSILAWEISRTEQPGGLQHMGSQEWDMTVTKPPKTVIHHTVNYALLANVPRSEFTSNLGHMQCWTSSLHPPLFLTLIPTIAIMVGFLR